MRVAVSGTHCSGKSTLIDHFLMAHPDFAHEPEPYTVLQEDYGELFAADPSADDFYRQLEFNLDRLRCYPPSERVIYERCPIDFMAYLLALDDLGIDNQAALLVEQSLDRVQAEIELLDLIVFLPLDGMDSNVMFDAEDQAFRIAVDNWLIDILRSDDLNLFSFCRPMILEVRGSTEKRLLQIESLLESQLGEGKDRG
ncbi:AAA family ATPase [Cyanobacteria bacterium FACHB-502]|nr:AAA family ATPase [Cyanobacteria bacterium FACHB-502]